MSPNTSPKQTRTVLGEISNISVLTTPKKRKLVTMEDSDHDVKLDTHKRTRIMLEKENIELAADEEGSSVTIVIPYEVKASQETLADHPESQDTIPDPDLPSSSSDRHPPNQLETPPRSEIVETQSTIKRAVPADAHAIASNMKCRLKLAMYKLQCHKEELNYKSLMPRPPRDLKIGSLPTPATQPPQPQNLTAHLNTPKPITSNMSNVRTLPKVMQRSSSGDASISETPIRRNYNLGLSSPPDSQEQLPQFLGVRLPDIKTPIEDGKSRHYRLPSISALGAFANQS